MKLSMSSKGKSFGAKRQSSHLDQITKRRKLRYQILRDNQNKLPDLQINSKDSTEFYRKVANALGRDTIEEFENDIQKLPSGDNSSQEKKWQLLLKQLKNHEDDINKLWNLIAYLKETGTLFKILNDEYGKRSTDLHVPKNTKHPVIKKTLSLPKEMIELPLSSVKKMQDNASVICQSIKEVLNGTIDKSTSNKLTLVLSLSSELQSILQNNMKIKSTDLLSPIGCNDKSLVSPSEPSDNGDDTKDFVPKRGVLTKQLSEKMINITKAIGLPRQRSDYFGKSNTSNRSAKNMLSKHGALDEPVMEIDVEIHSSGPSETKPSDTKSPKQQSKNSPTSNKDLAILEDKSEGPTSNNLKDKAISDEIAENHHDIKATADSNDNNNSQTPSSKNSNSLLKKDLALSNQKHLRGKVQKKSMEPNPKTAVSLNKNVKSNVKPINNKGQKHDNKEQVIEEVDVKQTSHLENQPINLSPGGQVINNLTPNSNNTMKQNLISTDNQQKTSMADNCQKQDKTTEEAEEGEALTSFIDSKHVDDVRNENQIPKPTSRNINDAAVEKGSTTKEDRSEIIKEGKSKYNDPTKIKTEVTDIGKKSEQSLKVKNTQPKNKNPNIKPVQKNKSRVKNQTSKPGNVKHGSNQLEKKINKPDQNNLENSNEYQLQHIENVGTRSRNSSFNSEYSFQEQNNDENVQQFNQSDDLFNDGELSGQDMLSQSLKKNVLDIPQINPEQDSNEPILKKSTTEPDKLQEISIEVKLPNHNQSKNSLPKQQRDVLTTSSESIEMKNEPTPEIVIADEETHQLKKKSMNISRNEPKERRMTDLPQNGVLESTISIERKKNNEQSTNIYANEMKSGDSYEKRTAKNNEEQALPYPHYGEDTKELISHFDSKKENEMIKPNSRFLSKKYVKKSQDSDLDTALIADIDSQDETEKVKVHSQFSHEKNVKSQDYDLDTELIQVFDYQTESQNLKTNSQFPHKKNISSHDNDFDMAGISKETDIIKPNSQFPNNKGDKKSQYDDVDIETNSDFNYKKETEIMKTNNQFPNKKGAKKSQEY